MSKNKTSEAQLRASKKYNQENKEYLRIKNYRAKGLKFIKEMAYEEDLLEFEKLINERRNKINTEK